ncbi:4Fe-4S binding protein [Candidatus Fermentibacteria bacterium]|nr:4Fe-4S binding protein [Candidatus Fermentibacteria bacterium]
MRRSIVLLLIAHVGLCLASCPLDYPPESACTAENPTCALFADQDGDELCDNPSVEPEPPAEADTSSASSLPPDTSSTEVVDSLPVPEETASNPSLASEEELIPEEPPEVPEEHEPSPVESTDADPVVTPASDTKSTESTRTDSAETVPPQRTGPTHESPRREGRGPGPAGCCPLGYTPSEACHADDPDCALFDDTDQDGYCNNPGPTSDTLGTVVAADSVPIEPCPYVVESGNTCPRYLDPQSACPDSLALCPHWYGAGPGVTCANPSGGKRRILLVLIGLAVLLPVSVAVSRTLRRRTKKAFEEQTVWDRLTGRTVSRKEALLPDSMADARARKSRTRQVMEQRRNAHFVIYLISLMVLGFGVQGCYCPLGAFQYLFIAGGLAFLGWIGVAILLLPIVSSALIGRVFCSWVCPMGALQHMLHYIGLPGKIKIPSAVEKRLHYLKYVILVALVTVLLLTRFGAITMEWPALFCNWDPFHTIFSFFLVGSTIVAVITIILSIYLGRFFCKYLCFYGALLSLFARTRIWRRITTRRVYRQLQEEVEIEEKEVEEES